MSTQSDVAGAVTAMLDAVDTLDRDRVRVAFADRVAVDYTSLFGGEAEALSADELVGRWQQLLPGFDATQHLTGPVLASPEAGGEAACVTTVRAYHHLVDGDDRRTWVVSGRYRMRLRQEGGRWAITAITLDTYFDEGGRDLADRAGRRAATGSGGRARSAAVSR